MNRQFVERSNLLYCQTFSEAQRKVKGRLLDDYMMIYEHPLQISVDIKLSIFVLIYFTYLQILIQSITFHWSWLECCFPFFPYTINNLRNFKGIINNCKIYTINRLVCVDLCAFSKCFYGVNDSVTSWNFS